MREYHNRLSYRLRSLLTWSPSVQAKRYSCEPYLKSLSENARQRADALLQQYGLNGECIGTSERGVVESLYVLDVLDRHLASRPIPKGRHLDVGAKNGVYLPGLNAFRQGWDAVELDAHRRYPDFTTRGAHAHAAARSLPGCHFIEGSVEQLSGPYALVTWFLPFVLEGPHRAWGLPRSWFRPEQLLSHVYSTLAVGGFLWIVNQGEHEATAQTALLEAQKLPYEALGPLESPLSPFTQPRWAFLVRRTP